MFRNASLPSFRGLEQQDFPNNSTGHIPSEMSQKYGEERRKKVRHQYSYYPVHEVKPAIQFLLEIVGQDTELYGESYTFNGQTLQFSGSYIPKNLRHDNQVLLFGSSAGSEVYLPGVGLPGNAFTEGGFQFHTLQNLVQDPFYNTGGDRLESAAYIFNGAISIALDHTATMNTSSRSSPFNNRRLPNANCPGVIIVYSKKPVYRSASFAAYLNAIRAIADGMSSLMTQRTAFKKGTNSRLERNLRIFRLSVHFISHFVTSYHHSHKEKPILNVSVPGLPRTGSMSFFVTTRDIDDIRLSSRDEEAARGLSKHDSSRHSKSNHREERRTGMDTSVHRDQKHHVRDEGMINGPQSRWIQGYFKKFMGGTVNMPARMTWIEGMISFLGVFVAVSSCILIFSRISDATPDALTFPASFGALSTLLYGLPAAPLAQPRVVVAAHLIALTVSIIVLYIFNLGGRTGDLVWLQISLACSFTVTFMAYGGVLHPPAGAISIIITQLGNKTNDLSNIDLLYFVISVLFALIIFTLVAMVVDNISPKRSYPSFW